MAAEYLPIVAKKRKRSPPPFVEEGRIEESRAGNGDASAAAAARTAITPFDDRILFFDRIELPSRGSPVSCLEHVYLVKETMIGNEGGSSAGDDDRQIWRVYDYSVTSLAKKHMAEFDSESAARRIVAGRRWANDPTYKYYRVPPDEMIAGWSATGAAASAAGTAMHARIEEFYLFLATTAPITEEEEDKYLARLERASPELAQFASFHREYVRGGPVKLSPWRAELRIFDEELRLAGSVDMIFAEEGDASRLHIVDWKRSRDIRTEGFAGETCSGPAPIRGRPACNWTAYSLQLNIYRAIIEKHMGRDVVVVSMGLGVFHPENPGGKWKYLPVSRDEAGPEALFAERRREVEDEKNGTAAH